MAAKNAETEQARMSIGQIKQFTGEVKNELGKVAWPEKKHTMRSTGVVVVLVIIISIYLGGVDLLLGSIVSAILR
jgi:preprotein translocase subunit SecE